MFLSSNEHCPPPFQVHNHPWNAWIVLKVVLGAIFLLPLRLFVGVGITVFTSICCKLSLVGVDPNSSKPLSSNRRKLVAQLIKWSSRVLLFCLGYHWVSERNKKNKKDDAAIVLCNHISFVDVVLLSTMFGGSFVSKDGVGKAPLIGSMCRARECIFAVRSDDPKKQRAATPQVKSFVEGTISERKKGKYAPPLVIFPEGTTSNGKFLLQFRKGAFIPGVPVQPVVLRYPFKFMDPTYLRSTVPQILLMLCQWHNNVIIEYLPVYHPSEKEAKDPQLYAKNVHEVMKKALNIPSTSYSLQDKLEFMDKYYWKKEENVLKSKKGKDS